MERRAIRMMLVMGCFLILPMISQAEEKGADNVYAAEIIDMSLYGDKGQEIGEIDDLVIKRNGKIKKVTMEVGGFLGIGDKLIAYPFRKLEIQNERISVSATQEELEKREEFDYYAQGLSRSYYYGPYPPYGLYTCGPYHGRYRGRYDGPGGWANVPYQGQDMGRQRYQSELWAYSPDRFLASVVLDRLMIDPTGRRLGYVRDFVINRKGEVEKIGVRLFCVTGEIH